MGKSDPRDPIYRGRRFSPEVIQQCVRWYVTYRLSYRDLVALMAEQGVIVSHTTLMRWVLRYVPEYERRWARYARSPDPSWRMDETAVAVSGGRHYLYRAVDRHGKSVASLLCGDRSIESAQAFFRTAVGVSGMPWPQKINLDGNSATHRAIRLLAKEDDRWGRVEVRARRYLNNVVEQDHRAIKQRCAPMLGLKTRRSAAITLAGIELAHRIRKQQHSLPMGNDRRPGARIGRRPRRSRLANAPELKGPSRRSVQSAGNRRAGPIRAQDSFRWKLVFAHPAARWALLAVQLPIRRKAKDAVAWHLSRRADGAGAVVASRCKATARRRR
jgi:transposase-like protein